MREVVGSNPGRTNSAAFVITKSSRIKTINRGIVWGTKEPTHCSKRVGDVVPGVVVWPCSGRGHHHFLKLIINCVTKVPQTVL